MLRAMKIMVLLWCVAGLIVPGRNIWSADANHNFAKWEKDISAFEQSDATNPPAKGGLLFTGSMTIANWKSLAQDFPGQPVINRGFGGSEVVDATHFADRIIFPYAPRKVFLRAGGNELWAGESADQVFADFQNFVAKVHGKLPTAEIVFISLSPSVARWKQRDLEKSVNIMVAHFVANTSYLKYVETYDLPLGPNGLPRPELFLDDQLHFSPACYRLLAERVRPLIKSNI